MPNGIPNWDEWNGLDEEARQYHLYTTLKSMDGRLTTLEGNKWVRGALQFSGGIVGGFIAIITLGKITVFRG